MTDLCDDCTEKVNTIKKIDSVLSEISPKYKKYLAKKAAGYAGFAGSAALGIGISIALTAIFPPAGIFAGWFIARSGYKIVKPLMKESNKLASINKSGEVVDAKDLIKTRNMIQKDLKEKYEAYHKTNKLDSVIRNAKRIFNKYNK